NDARHQACEHAPQGAKEKAANENGDIKEVRKGALRAPGQVGGRRGREHGDREERHAKLWRSFPPGEALPPGEGHPCHLPKSARCVRESYRTATTRPFPEASRSSAMQTLPSPRSSRRRIRPASGSSKLSFTSCTLPSRKHSP